MIPLKECGNYMVSLADEIGKELFDIDEIIKMAVLTIFASPEGKYSHILLEAPPGMGKTVLCKTIASWCNMHFTRIQLTPDMQPGEIVMTNELVMSEKGVHTKMVYGPIFTNILLADEINRTPPRTQSSILEPMAEMQTTYGGRTYNLGFDMSALSSLKGDAFNDELKRLYNEKTGTWLTPATAPLFYVFATQNPIENEGTYRLPEAQLDRFLFKLTLEYPSEETMREIIRRKAVVGQYCNTFFNQHMDELPWIKSILESKDPGEEQLDMYRSAFMDSVSENIQSLFPFDIRDERMRKILQSEVEKIIFKRAPQFKQSRKKSRISPRLVIDIRNSITLQVGINDSIYYNYITYIIEQILASPDFEMKVSPRFCDTIISVAKAHALFRAYSEARENNTQDIFPDTLYITKEDINSCARHMLAHRVSLSYEAQSKDFTTVGLIENILFKAYSESRFRGIE